ncbi:MAG: S41 family peptidase, partial [Planctomycetota bacterium]
LGTRTFGKGSVQSLIPIEDRNSALKLTIAKYYTPSGTQIDESGIEPDIKVDLTKTELKGLHTHLSRSHATDILTENGNKVSGGENKTGFVDAQLARAIDILKGINVYAQITGEDG